MGDNTTYLKQLMATTAKQEFSKSQVVHVFEDSAMLNYITTGYVKRYRITDEGNQSIQVVYGPGQIFPLTPVYKTLFDYDMYSGPEQYFYETITPLTTFSIDQTDLKKAVTEKPELYKDLFFAAGLRLDSYIHRLEGHAQKSATQTVAWQLAYLASTFGKTSPNGTTIQLPLTHQLLADIVGLARETVTHCLHELRTKGVIAIDGRNITVRDLASLRGDQ